MVAQIRRVDVTVTHTESEALILENQLIKGHSPRYNVLLRDGKSYPYLYLSTEHTFPRLSMYRGALNGKGRYFGPFPSAGAVRESLSLLQKIFGVRPCEDTFFRNRSRPCLQYQIHRCAGPCAGGMSEEDYQQRVTLTELFLEGKNGEVIESLVEQMETSSTRLNYEKAAEIRDQIGALKRVQETQHVIGEKGDIDIVAAVVKSGASCVSVGFVRHGRSLGSKCYFPRTPSDMTESSVLNAFLPQFYLGKNVPREVILSHTIEDEAWLAQTLTEQESHKVRVTAAVRGERRHWLEMASTNAQQGLVGLLGSRAGMRKRLIALQELLESDELPSRMECFDISHSSGEATVASCVVFNQEGPLKSDYRRFNIKGITPGDDYAAMRQALSRRYTRIQKGEGALPDVLFIDGGKGQTGIAGKVLAELQIDSVTIVGVAKGRDRKPGCEELFVADSKLPVLLPADSPALHLIQQIRDEAHRFAITGHRQRRANKRNTSTLEDIPGLGQKRRQTLLKHFGGLQEVVRAGVDDLTRVPGISRNLAQKIYDRYHAQGDS